MRRIVETGHEEDIEDDRIQLFISTGAGNTPQPEIHITMIDPLSGEEIRAWFYRDEFLGAALDPEPEVRASAVLGATVEEPTA